MTDTLKNLKLNSIVGSATILEICRDFYMILSLQIDENLLKINDSEVLDSVAISKIFSDYDIQQYDIYFRDNKTGAVERVARLTQANSHRTRTYPGEHRTVKVISQIDLIENTVSDCDIYNTFTCEHGDNFLDSNKDKFIGFVDKIINNPKFGKTCTMNKQVSELDSDTGKFVEVRLVEPNKKSDEALKLSYIFEGNLVTPGVYKYRLKSVRFPQDLCE